MTRHWQGGWLWSAQSVPERNAFVRFRRQLDYREGAALLHITADSRYTVWLNGRYLGQGPVRAWPNHWRYDTYDLTPELDVGENVVAVLVNSYGEGTFQYIPGPPGLLAQIELDGQTIASDETWRATPEAAFVAAAPRISVQEGLEEQFDAGKSDGWTTRGYDDGDWPAAALLRPADDGNHRDLAPRQIPMLTLEPVLPQRVIGVEVVQSIPYRFTIYAKPYLVPDDRSSNFVASHSYAVTQVFAPEDCDVTVILPHKRPAGVKINGAPVAAGEATRLHAGWNSLVLSLRMIVHLYEFVVCLDGPPGLRFSARGADGSAEWAIAGPFGLGDEEQRQIAAHKDPSTVVAAPREPSATLERGETLWSSGDATSVVDEPFFQPVRPEHLPAVDVFVQAYTDRAVTPDAGLITSSDGLLSGAEWTVVQPSSDGADVRLLIDWGREVVGFHRFEIAAAAGTILDCHNFEFIQPDGRYNFAEGMNNSFRYICGGGREEYQTYVRRGFRYSYLILRNMTAPAHIRRLEVLFSSYPQRRRGSFTASDALLTQIWEVGAHTLRCCAEDTYTDCPTYEQTHWVGDGRNEALIDWAANGDERLWYRCLEQAGQSLDRSPIVESHVPSAWVDILPAWSFLWMRSCREYVLFTGDRERGRELLAFVERNVQGVKAHLNAAGLFEIQAWNMFDWADMDTPSQGVVTHNNCFAVHALRDVAELADWLDAPQLGREWRALADSISAAVNTHLWNEGKRAYTDCLRGDRQSAVFSQQTQTVAFMSGVAGDHSQECAAHCRDAMHHPPEGFVKAGSPFFEFFLLEAYADEARDQEFLDTIRRDWGFMVEMGATTFWEMWSGRSGRLTRSHCHGWSAAPTFFLSTHVLGVRPGGAGYAPVLVEPHPGDLRWCRGSVPTPRGDVGVQWENEPGRPFALRIEAPEGVDVQVRLPRDGTATVNGRAVDAVANGTGAVTGV